MKIKHFDFPKGHAAWCYEDMAQNAARIAAYNALAQKDQKIQYAFAWGGSLDFENGKVKLHLDLNDPLRLATHLQGQTTRVFAIVDGISDGSESLSARDWKALGERLAKTIHAEERLAGLHLDVEPHQEHLHVFFDAFRRASQKPLSVAVAHWQADIFDHADQVVLMGYDLATTPQAFEDAASDQYKRFLRDARGANAKVLIGIPLIATHLEHEGQSDTQAGPVRATGFTMADFVQAARRAVTQALEPSDSAFLGLSIWALSVPGGLHNRHDTVWFHPTHIPQDLLMTLATPFVPNQTALRSAV